MMRGRAASLRARLIPCSPITAIAHSLPTIDQRFSTAPTGQTLAATLCRMARGMSANGPANDGQPTGNVGSGIWKTASQKIESIGKTCRPQAVGTDIAEEHGQQHVISAQSRRAIAGIAAGIALIAGVSAKKSEQLRARLPLKGMVANISSSVSAMQKQAPKLKSKLAESAPRMAGSFTSGMAALQAAAVDSRKYWRTVTPDDCAAACDELLRSTVRTPFTTKRVAGLYTIECQAPYEGAPVLVLMHGYGSGSGLWLFNLDELARHFHVYAVDWLGCGASDRPQWRNPGSVEKGERFFTESLEQWRREQGLDKPFTLGGHSLGGYLSSAYVLHHPGKVKHLVLISPAGIPVPPDPEQLAQRRSHWLISLLRWSAQWAWESGVTPQSIIRALGPLGEKWAADILSARFKRMLEERRRDVASRPPHEAADAAGAAGSNPVQGGRFDERAFVKYLYAITVAEGSGEFALNVLLSFGAHAREPMGPRLLHAARVGEVAEEGEPGHPQGKTEAQAKPHKFNTPITLMYGGSHDWMDAPAGYRLAHDLRAAGVDAAWFAVEDSGHHLYMENPKDFNAKMLSRIVQRQAKFWR